MALESGFGNGWRYANGLAYCRGIGPPAPVQQDLLDNVTIGGYVIYACVPESGPKLANTSAGRNIVVGRSVEARRRRE
jgi:hypothetical protein